MASLESYRVRAEARLIDAHWPEPQPLPSGLPDVQSFDLQLLPQSLQPWVSDISERMQCPADFVAAPAVVAAGSLIGRKVLMRPQARSDWAVSPNQWGLLVGRPGVMKSPAMGEALGPLKRLEGRAFEAFEKESKRHSAESKLSKMQAELAEKEARKALEKTLKDGSVSKDELLGMLSDDEVDAPTPRRYSTNDSTAAALGELHIKNPNGLLVVRDELVALLKSLDRDDNAEGRGFYLTGWNGTDSYTIDRILRGMNLRIPAVCLSLVGSTQPGRIAEYVRHAVRGGSGDDGLIQRFGLTVWPDSPKTWKECDRWPDSEAKATAFRVFEHLDAFEPQAIGAETSVSSVSAEDGHSLRFAPSAQGLFSEWRADLEGRLRSGDLSPALESHFAKYRKLLPGLALIFHLVDFGTGPVSEDALLRALAWSEYLDSHARRLYASVELAELGAAKALLAKIRAKELPGEFAVRDVVRKGWAHLSETSAVKAGVELLCDLDWLVEEQRRTEGRTATVYLVNPRGLL